MGTLIRLMESCILKVSRLLLTCQVRFCFLMFLLIPLAREVLPQWDKQIQSLCYQVNGIIEKIGQAEPEFMIRVLEEPMAH